MEIHNQIADLEREIAQTEDAANAAELEAETVVDSTSAE
jgi:hypothetical protein